MRLEEDMTSPAKKSDETELPSSLKEIMRLQEGDLNQVVFFRHPQEAGINIVFDPQYDREHFQVFIQSTFPFREIESWLFESFREARNFAASKFKNWEFHFWSQGVKRPCGGGDSCGGGKCSTISTEGATGSGCGGGCSSCGATKDFDELLAE